MHWKSKRWKPLIPWIVSSAVATIIFGVAALFMWAIGMFDAVKDDEQLLAASLVVVGSILSAVVALIGIVVKYSIDARAQQSNRIDVAIRAVALLSEDTTSQQNGGALLALVSLGELELAVSLLAGLWPKGAVTSHVAEVVIQSCLKDGTENDATNAAMVLRNNSDKIEFSGGYIWAVQDLTWRRDLPENCRIFLILAACEWLCTSLERNPDGLPLAISVLYPALDDPVVHEFAVAALVQLSVFPSGMTVGVGSRRVAIGDVMSKLPEEFTTGQDLAIHYYDRIRAALMKRNEVPGEST